MLRYALIALTMLPAAAAVAQAAPEGYRDVTVPAGRQPVKMFAPIAKAQPAARTLADVNAKTLAMRPADAAAAKAR